MQPGPALVAVSANSLSMRAWVAVEACLLHSFHSAFLEDHAAVVQSGGFSMHDTHTLAAELILTRKQP